MPLFNKKDRTVEPENDDDVILHFKNHEVNIPVHFSDVAGIRFRVVWYFESKREAARLTLFAINFADNSPMTDRKYKVLTNEEKKMVVLTTQLQRDDPVIEGIVRRVTT